MNFPHHSYLGPGNKLENQKHLDKDDFIARLHDEAYETNPDKAHEEDFIAIHEFANEAEESPHAIVGALGLGAKYIYETFGGQVYPMPPPVKRLPDHPLTPPNTPRKIPKFETSGESNEYSGEELDEVPRPTPTDENTGGEITDPVQPTPATTEASPNMSGGGSASSEPGGTGINRIIMRGRGATKFSLSYHRHFTVSTISNANAILSQSSVPSELQIANGNHLVTPLCPINPNQLFWYMTESEFNLLPAYSFAKKCRIKVTPLNYRTNFETNATNSISVNSQQPIDILYNVGLNTFINMAHVKPTFNAATPMVVSAVNSETHPQSQANINLIEQGRMRLQEPYLAYRAMFAENTYLDKYVNRENLIQVKGHPVIDYEYNFKVSPIKKALNPWTACPNTRLSYVTGQVRPQTFSKLGVGTANSTFFENDTNVQFEYFTGIEKCTYMSMQTENNHNANAVPMIYIGGPAVPSSLPGATSPTFANCFLTWSIETYLEIDCNINILSSTNLLPGLQPQYLNHLSMSVLQNGRHNVSYSGNIFTFIAGYMSNAMNLASLEDQKKLIPESEEIEELKNKIDVIDGVVVQYHKDFALRKARFIQAQKDQEAEQQKQKKAKRSAPDDEEPFDYKLAVLRDNEGVKELFDLDV